MPDMQDTRARLTVPSKEWPTLKSAIVEHSSKGAFIDVLAGHHEDLDWLVLDVPFEIEGPADQSATFVVEQGIICASQQGGLGSLVLRSLTLKSKHNAPVVTVAGQCCIEFCKISGDGIGLQVMANGDSDEPPCITQNCISGCDVGVCFAGHSNLVFDRNRVEKNRHGIVIIGLELLEGDSDGLAILGRTSFNANSVMDLKLSSLAIKDARDKICHRVDADADLILKRFDRAESISSKTDRGSVVLRIDGMRTYAALSGTSIDGIGGMNGIGILPCHGRWWTSVIPGSAKAMKERKRDFARLVAPDGPRSFLVVAPGESPPTTWMRHSGVALATDVSTGTGEAATSDLAQWLTDALAGSEKTFHPGLEDRCISLLSAGEGVGFALTYGLTPVLLQPHFVLLVSSRGEVRIVWFVYVTDEARPDARSGRCLVRLLSDDLNGNAVAEMETIGARLKFTVSMTDEPDMAQIVARNTGTLRRAADESAWESILATF